MHELALFAGAGGGILGGILLGWRTVCAVELDPYCRSVLLARQRDGLLPRFPIWDDVRTFDGKPWNGSIDVVSGGFPCQDISTAAGTRKGINGEKSGLWLEMARVIREVRPHHVFVENSPNLASLGLGRVLGDLAAMGFDARWGVLGACCLGAPHYRERMWIVAHATGKRRGKRDAKEREAEQWRATLVDRHAAHAPRFGGGSRRNETVGDEPSLTMPFGRDAGSNASDTNDGRQRELAVNGEVAWSPGSRSADDQNPADADCTTVRLQQGRRSWSGWEEPAVARVDDWWPVDLISGVDDGMAHRVDRVAATGNGQVPGVAALAWEALSHGR